jgi:hypothetical protein
MHGLFARCGQSLLLMMKAKCMKCIVWFSHQWKKKKTLKGPKLDSSFKHVGHQKYKFFMPKVDACSYYVNKNLGHSKNEW